MIPFSKMAFLIEPLPDGYYKSMALTGERGNGYLPVQPVQVGGGKTPIAALLRLITPLREDQPYPAEARAALSAAMIRVGTTVASLARKSDYSEATLRKYFSAEHELPYEAVLTLADVANVPLSLFKSELRSIQRAYDLQKDGPH